MPIIIDYDNEDKGSNGRDYKRKGAHDRNTLILVTTQVHG